MGLNYNPNGSQSWGNLISGGGNIQVQQQQQQTAPRI
jgi:hypothetical protein